MQRVPRPAGPDHVLLPAERRVASYRLVLVERTTRLPEPAPGDGRWRRSPEPFWTSRAAVPNVER
jgi:hypothetical protein